MEMIRHFTATTYVVYKDKVLLHFHKKLRMWLPVGGHIEPNELPEEAALREVKEESGLLVELYNPDSQYTLGNIKQLIRPMYVLLEDIRQVQNPYHQHIDLVYYARAAMKKICLSDDGSEINWFSMEEVEKLEAEECVKTMAKEAVRLLNVDK